MSGTRERDPLAQLDARMLPSYQIPGRLAPGSFRYPQFGTAPRVIPPAAAPRVTAQPIASAPGGAAGGGTGGAQGRGGDATDQGAGFTGQGVRSGWGTQDRDPNAPDDLGPDPGRINSLADLANVGRTLANFATAATLQGPLGAVRAATASPVGYGLAKSLSAATGISAATPAPADLSTLSKPDPEDFADRALSGVINSVVGFSNQLGGPKGTPKGPAAPAAPAEVAATPVAPAAPAAAVAAAPATETPAKSEPPAEGVAMADKDFGDAPAESFNAENTTATSEAKGDSGDGGGKGADAGTGANSENSSPGGGDKGGEFRMGGPVQRDTDGHLEAVPILAHENEFVLSPEATAMIGPDLLQRINDMALEAAGHPPRPMDPRFAGASPLGQLRAGAPAPAFVSVRAQAPQPRPGAGSGFSENTLSPGMFPRQGAGPGQQFVEDGMTGMGAGPQPLPMPPPAPPPMPARAAAQPARRGMTADDLNAMSLGIAQGTGAPPPGAQERLAYERIRSVMRPGEEPQQFRMGGLVRPQGAMQPAAPGMHQAVISSGAMPMESDSYDHAWGQHLPHGLHGHQSAPMPTLGYEGDNAGPQGPMEFGYEDLIARFGGDDSMPAFRMGGLVEAPQQQDDGAGMPGSFLPRSARPYANEGQGDMPFGDDPASKAGAGTDDVAQRLMQLPPDMQQAVAMAIGSDPTIASALLHVLGPHFAPVIQAAMKVASPPQPDPLAQMMGEAPMGMPPAAPMG